MACKSRCPNETRHVWQKGGAVRTYKSAIYTMPSSDPLPPAVYQKQNSKIMAAAAGMNPRNQSPKVFNDPVHGHIELHPLLVAIIDTPEFQRLRHIKQLGGAYWVYPGASHNRFEHSIGVAHLAGRLARNLLKQEGGNPSRMERDILCVEIAGLCHDLGHGPFSHMFDRQFMKKCNPELNWKHEVASIEMFVHLITKNKLLRRMEACDLLLKEDIQFICELIYGPNLPFPHPKSKSKECPHLQYGEQEYKGRGEEQHFLYEIVNNNTNGIDVDKMDYFARDCHHLGIRNSFDHERFLMFARVCRTENNQKKEICMRDKEAINMYELFHTRHSLHERAYQHKAVKIIEAMMTDVLLEAEDNFFQDHNISETINDMAIYSELTDGIFEQILLSESANLATARNVLERVVNRDLYKCVLSTIIPLCEENQAEDDVRGLLQNHLGDEYEETDFKIIHITIDYGKMKDNPVNYLNFYGKRTPDQAAPIPKHWVSHLLPEIFIEKKIIVCDKRNREIEWTELNGLQQVWSSHPNDCPECQNLRQVHIHGMPAGMPDQPGQ